MKTGKPEEEETADDVDLILRHVSRQFPRELSRALIETDAPVEPIGWVDTQVTGRQRRLDRALAVEVGGVPWLLHVEWALVMTEDLAFRVFEYHNLTALAAADEARRTGKTPPHIASIVIVLSGREEPWPSRASYRTSPPEHPFSGVHFRIEAVYQRRVAELRARENPFWLIFAPLSIDADEHALRAVLEELRAQTTEREFAELGAAMVALGDADRRERGFGRMVYSLLPREIIMQNRIFEEGKALGLEQGIVKGLEQGIVKGLEQGMVKGQLEAFVHQAERRLRRPLHVDEHRALADRLQTEGPNRVGDAILDLSADELLTWLGKPRRRTQSHRRAKPIS